LEPSSVVNSVETEPRLWIQRLVIFSDLPANNVIRDIGFERGLNIVWGTSRHLHSEGRGSDDDFLSGHSVGKTTLCRLIRYGLDEETFGQNDTVEQIRFHFKNGGVGLTVYIAGVPWSVVRRFSSGSLGAKAAPQATVEDLLDLSRQSDSDYQDYRKTLQEQLTKDIPGFDGPDAFKWKDLLAWLARDQEARFETLYKWRDPRSNSQTAVRSKGQALRLIASVLCLLTNEANLLVRKRDNLDATRHDLSAKLDLYSQRRDHDITTFDVHIAAILKRHGCYEEVADGLFAIGILANRCHDHISGIILQLEQEKDSVEWELHGLNASELVIKDQIYRVAQRLEIEKDLVESPDGDRLEDLKARMPKLCIPGDVLYADCSYMMSHMSRLKKQVPNLLSVLREEFTAGQSDGASQRIETWVAQQLNVQDQLIAIQSKVQARRMEVERLDGIIRELHLDLGDLARLIDHRTQADVESPLANELLSVEKEAKQCLEALVKEQFALAHVRLELEGLFNRIVRFLLAPRYIGRVRVHKDELIEFRLEGKKGEAVSTLTSVIADITAMMLSVEGYGRHPRFLIHDSPREGDLDASAYEHFLRCVYELSELLGGKAAPFQYIITTTTKPPDDIADARRLTLSGAEAGTFLFKRNLEDDMTLDV